MDDAGALERQHIARSRVAIKNEQELFVIDGIDDSEDYDQIPGDKRDRSAINHKFFLGFVLRVHVPVEQVWYVYRNGKLYKKLSAGTYTLWNWGNFLTKWQIRRINLRTVILPALAYGRVEGPELPQGSERGANISLALDVGVDFRLLCRITDIERFLSYELPIKVFYASFNDIVQERISKLLYDQYGRWATVLRNQVQEDLQIGRDNTEALIGVKIEKVFVDSFAFSGEHHAEVLKLYQLVESGKRELEGAISLEKQSQLLDIAPSILALQNNEIGRELIRHDAKLRELMIAVGLRPGGTFPILDTLIIESRSYGYLSSPPFLSYPLPSAFVSHPGYSQESSQPDPRSHVDELSDSSTSAPSKTLALRQRRKMDKEQLRQSGFVTSGWGPVGTFDSSGQSGNITWSLQVYIQRDDGYLVILFQSSPDYPMTAPDVQVRTSRNGWKDLWPSTITNWRPESSLVEVVHEINEGIPDRNLDDPIPSLNTQSPLIQASLVKEDKQAPPLSAIARIILEDNEKAFVHTVYLVQAEIVHDKPIEFSAASVVPDEENSSEPLEFTILLHASEYIELLTERQKRLHISNASFDTAQRVSFEFKVLSTGHHSLDINFYHKQRWLKTFHVEFDAIEKFSTVASSEE